MARAETWELLSLVLVAAASILALVHAAPGSFSLAASFRGATFSAKPETSVGLAGLGLATFGSFASIILGQLRPAGSHFGASLLALANLVVLSIGDSLFYSGQLQSEVVLIIGVSSAILSIVSLFLIANRPFRAMYS